MKILYFSAFMFAMIALTNALDAQLDDYKTAKSDLVKRSARCSRGWTPLNGRCFRYIPRPMSWAKAERNCVSMRGNLASVHDIEEYHEIQRLIMTSSHEYKETWIGGTDAQEVLYLHNGFILYNSLTLLYNSFLFCRRICGFGVTVLVSTLPTGVLESLITYMETSIAFASTMDIRSAGMTYSAPTLNHLSVPGKATEQSLILSFTLSLLNNL
uniref:Ladderlectin-like n=1 Tax=Cyprinodon variegatus TaxID=28743 RepID=A0A3Q2DBB6_CYPVA